MGYIKHFFIYVCSHSLTRVDSKYNRVQLQFCGRKNRIAVAATACDSFALSHSIGKIRIASIAIFLMPHSTASIIIACHYT